MLRRALDPRSGYSRKPRLEPITAPTTFTRHRNLAAALRSVVLAAIALAAVVAVPAEAATLVGDSGSRSLTIESSQFTANPFASATTVPSAPMAIDLAPDGGFTVPASALSWAGVASIPPQSVASPACGASITIGAHSQTFTLAAASDGSGLVNPAAGTAHLGVDATFAAGQILLPLHQASSVCSIGAIDATLACTFASIPVHLDLDGAPADLTDTATGTLKLQGGSVGLHLTPVCSGAAIFGSQLAAFINWLDLYYGARSGTLALVAQMTPGAHSPVAPVFDGASSASGSPSVGGTLTCAPGAVTGLPTPTVTIDWLRDGMPIAGATGSSYLLQGDDGGHRVACRAHAVNMLGTADSTSDEIAIAQPATSTTGDSSLPGTDQVRAGTPEVPNAGQTRPATPRSTARCVAPKLKGLTLAAAKRKLKKSHCRVGRVTKIKSKLKHGRVVRTQPRPGTRKPAGSRVALIVSR
jgi:PASTA domain